MSVTLMAMLLPKSWPTVQSLDVRTIMTLLAVLGRTYDYDAIGQGRSN